MSTLAQDYLALHRPIFIGMVLSWCLLGTLVFQVYIYILTYPEDSRRLKCLIGVLFTLEVLQTGFITHYAWVTLVSGWGRPIDSPPWSGATFPIMSGLRESGTFGCQSVVYFARIASVLIAMVAMLQGAAAVYGGIVFGISRTWERVAQLTWIVEIWLGGSTICNMLIAAAMITILTEASRGSPWKPTTVMINKFMIYAIETGAVTAVTALVDLVLFERYKNTGIHQGPTFLLGKLYTSALLVSLNGRQRRRDDIAIFQQSIALGDIRIHSTIVEDSGSTLRPNTPSQMDGSRSKNEFVLPSDTAILTVDSDSKLSTTFTKTLESPV